MYSILDEHGHCSADNGTTYPMTYTCKEYTIVPFYKLTTAEKEYVSKHLQSVWSTYTVNYIEFNWSYGDILYVCMDASTKEIMGSVSVDRKNFLPFIGSLYVLPHLRNQGCSTKLLRFAEKYVSYLGFNVAYIWCENDLDKFYEKHGYTIDKKESDTVLIMCKKLMDI